MYTYKIIPYTDAFQLKLYSNGIELPNDIFLRREHLHRDVKISFDEEKELILLECDIATETWEIINTIDCHSVFEVLQDALPKLKAIMITEMTLKDQDRSGLKI